MLKVTAFSCFVTMFFCRAAGFGFGFDFDEYEFTLGVGAEFYYGTSFEIVYRENGDYLSELQWELKPLFLLALKASLGPKKNARKRGFFSELELAAGIPAKTGSMEDRDWLESTVPGSLSLFSRHDNHTNGAFTVEATAGVSFPLGSLFFIDPLVSFDYMYFDFESHDGYIQYGGNSPENPDGSVKTDNLPFDPSWPKIYTAGRQVRYRQYWFLLSAGSRFGLYYNGFFCNFSFKITPLVFCYAVDTHYLRNLYFTDTMFGIVYMEPQLTLGCDMGKFRLEGFFSYRYIAGTIGFQEVIDVNSGSSTSGFGAGAGFESFRGGITIHCLFF
ncbi:MAG: omptin family outer membrane protease [Treponema sp.]|nr:omptin family outer membrane protease [Treponema sp.]